MDFNEEYIKTLLPKRPQDAHKGTFGHVLNIAGSQFYTGAAYFSSISPLRVGCGRSTLASVRTALTSASSLSPDIILLPIDLKAPLKTIWPKIEEYNAISIGCGLSVNKETGKLFSSFIKELTKKQIETPVVIDADGLNILSFSGNLKLPKHTILTPHPLEMSRMLGVKVDEVLLKPEYWAKKCSEKYDCTTILKIHKTVVADNRGRVYINNTGNTALSKGGSGDILCGMITGFLAQGLSTFNASILAVYLHGKTAEIASKDLSEYSVLASDLLNYIPLTIRELI